MPHPALPRSVPRPRFTGRTLVLVVLLTTVSAAFAGCLQSPDEASRAPGNTTPGSVSPAPDASPAPGAEPTDAAWPREGSFATYHVESSGGAPDGSFETRLVADVTFTFKDGHWTGACTGTRRTLVEGVLAGEEPVTAPVLLPPPRVTENTDGTVTAHVLVACGPMPLPLTGDSPGHGVATDECACRGAEASWRTDANLVTAWWSGGYGTGVEGRLVDSDVP